MPYNRVALKETVFYIQNIHSILLEYQAACVAK